MKRLLLTIIVLTLPQVIFGAEKIRPAGVAAAPSRKSSIQPQFTQKGYRYAQAPTPAALEKWNTCRHPDVGLEALLWRVAGPGFGYVNSSESGLATLISAKPGYDWGVRAYAGYTLPSCWGVQVSYLYFDSRYSDRRSRDTATPPLLTPVFSPGDVAVNQAFAQAKIHDKFQSVDAVIDATLLDGYQFHFKAFGGARGVDQRTDEAYTYIDFASAETTAMQRTRFRGAGPRFGLWSSFHPIPCGIFQGFSFDGTLATATIIARQADLFQGSIPFFLTTDTGINRPKSTLIVPSFDVKLRVNYCIDWGPLNWSIYAAYELQWYQNARERVTGSAGTGAPSFETTGLGFAGWSFGMKAKY